jgi:hypothetical protein
MAKRVVLRVTAGMVVALAGAQFIRPELPRPPVTAELQTPVAVKDILRTSCFPCHSNELRLSWFDQIVPAYQLVVHDIRQARLRLNFSELGAKPQAIQSAALFEAVNHIQMGAMPLKRYTRLHPEANINPTQLAILRDYVRSLEPKLLAETESIEAEHAPAAVERLAVQVAPNGIEFMPDYKSWKVISSTERSDSATLRQILGNDVAIKAIAERRINPWPDGATLAKVVWHQKTGDGGVIESGDFVHVAFMIKDKKKYASTAGWGWAQWNGTSLAPFGDGEHFANNCVACHAPLEANDYVFTMPIPSSHRTR